MSLKLINRPGFKYKRAGGFTLVELALVMLFLGLFLTLLFTVSLQTSRLTRTTYKSARKNALIYRAFQHIILSLNNAFFVENHKHLIFRGKKEGGADFRTDRLSFASADPYSSPQNQESEVKEVSFYLKQAPDSTDYRLIKREASPVDEKPLEGGAHYVLLENVASLEFRYGRRLSSDSFEEEWDSALKKRMPQKIEVKLTVNQANGQQLTLTGLALPGMGGRR